MSPPEAFVLLLILALVVGVCYGLFKGLSSLSKRQRGHGRH